MISGRVVGAEVVIARLGTQLPATAMARTRATVRALGLTLQARVVGGALNGGVLRRRSGRGARSINTRFTGTSTSETASTGTALSYLVMWELTGSREYVIVPVKKKALYWPGALHPVARVVHPAQAPRPFLRPTLEAMRPEIRGALTNAMRNL